MLRISRKDLFQQTIIKNPETIKKIFQKGSVNYAQLLQYCTKRIFQEKFCPKGLTDLFTMWNSGCYMKIKSNKSFLNTKNAFSLQYHSITLSLFKCQKRNY